MKKLLFIIFLFTCTAGLAQDGKPTKKQTIAFMEKALKAGVGMSYEWRATIQEVSYDGDLLLIETQLDGKNRTYHCTNLPWEYLDAGSFESDNSYCNFTIHFSKDYKRKDKYAEYPEQTEFLQALNISIPQDKIESFKKACIRLSEIAKEENKDPFEN